MFWIRYCTADEVLQTFKTSLGRLDWATPSLPRRANLRIAGWVNLWCRHGETSWWRLAAPKSIWSQNELETLHQIKKNHKKGSKSERNVQSSKTQVDRIKYMGISKRPWISSLDLNTNFLVQNYFKLNQPADETFENARSSAILSRSIDILLVAKSHSH